MNAKVEVPLVENHVDPPDLKNTFTMKFSNKSSRLFSYYNSEQASVQTFAQG